MNAARERLDAAGQDPSEVFAPLGEVLFWLVALDDVYERTGDRDQKMVYKQRRDDHQAGDLLRGMRYVRNHVAHHPDAWDLARVQDNYAKRYYNSYANWTWKELPPETDPRAQEKREAYDSHLLGTIVLDSVYDVLDFLHEANPVHS